MKSEADLKEVGLPVYPGSRLREDSKESAQATLGLWISDKGFRLVAVKYESSDGPEKVLAYYREGPQQVRNGASMPGGWHDSIRADVQGPRDEKRSRRSYGRHDGEAADRGRRARAARPRTRFELVYLRTKGVEAN